MFAIDNKVNEGCHQFAIALACGGHIGVVRVALNRPNSPQRHIRQINALQMLVGLTGFHPGGEGFGSSVHNFFKIRTMVIRQCATGQCNKFISCTEFEPRIAGKHIVTIGIGHIKLLGAIF